MSKLFKSYIFNAVAVPVICSALAVTSYAGWKRINSGTLAWLRSVYFVDENRGWVVGGSGTFLVTNDGGKTWSQGKKFTADNIRDVYFYDSTRGWLLCERDQFEKGSRAASYFLKTIDGGQTWEHIDLKSPEVRLVRFFFSKNGIGFAAGEGGAIWQLLDDEKTWKRVEVPSRYLILDGQFIDDFRAVMVGGGATVLSSIDAGVEWKALTLSSPGRLNSVYFLDGKIGWAAGSAGRLFSTNDGGRSWTERRSGVSSDFFDIVFLNLREGYAIGDAGQIVGTVDAGTTWTQEKSGVTSSLEGYRSSGRPELQWAMEAWS